MNHSTRRGFIRTATALAAGTVMTGLRSANAAPIADVEEIKVITPPGDSYSGWPTLTRRNSGELLVVCSGGREAHVCPFGRVEMITSHDDGLTWTWPRVLLDGPIDDRDAGVIETAKGSLLVTTFTSLAYEQQLKVAEQKAGQAGAWSADRLRAWRGVHQRLSDAERPKELGVWMIRSTDGGITWSPRYDALVNSPHGPIQLKDGRLLYAGKDIWRPGERTGVCESSDDGQSWRWLADVPLRPGDSIEHYHELHAVETSDGRIIVQIRNHNKANDNETLQCESADGGKTWTVPKPIGVWGLPSHLLRLRDDRLLMTYGHRRAPLGNQARISADHGRSWSEPIVISGDGASGDLGYPSTVELKDGTLLTVWYEVLKGSPRATLRQARWKLKA